ncbi:MAG: hypothetical protein ACU4EQ_01680 [Candidatus Nitrosoglobus sp.]|jgi:ribosomal 30S subunit maturation factor RimM
MHERIKEGFMVFVSDGDEGIGSVRQVMPNGRSELIIYVENSGDFFVPLAAVKAVHFGKVILNCDLLDLRLRAAIGHAHDAENLQYES